MLKHLLPVVLCSVLVTAVMAETADELYIQLRTELRAELKSAVDKGNDPGSHRSYRLETFLSESFSADSLADANPRSLMNSLSQLRSITKSEKAQKLTQQLTDALRAEKLKKDKEALEAFALGLRENAALMLKATKASDLDAPLVNVQKLIRQNQQTEDGSRLKGIDFEQAQALQQTMIAWQDALMAQSQPNAGRNSDFSESNVLSYARSLGDLIPRSVLIERSRAIRQSGPGGKRITAAEAEAQTRDLVREIRKLDDLAPTVQKIEKLYASARDFMTSGNEGQTISTLRLYRRNYEEMKAGNAVALSFASGPSHYAAGSDDLAAIRGMLVRYALPRILQAKENALPTENENSGDYLMRMAELAKTEKDWGLLSRVLDAAQSLNMSVMNSPNDVNAVRLLLAGVNQEKAKQLVGAVASYLAALKTGSQAIPSEWLGGQLEAIRTASPNSYERGIAESSGRTESFGRPYPSPSSQPGTLFVPPQTKPAAPPEKTAPEKTAPEKSPLKLEVPPVPGP